MGNAAASATSAWSSWASGLASAVVTTVMEPELQRLAEAMGQKVGSEALGLVDDATLPRRAGSRGRTIAWPVVPTDRPGAKPS